MAAYYARLFFQALFAIPSSLGSNWLGLVFPAVVVLVGEVIACLLNGWRVMISKWKQATLYGLAGLGVCYLILFLWCGITQNYGDFSSADNRASLLQKTVDTADSSKRIAVLDAKNECAKVVGQNEIFSQQNRDQQNTINNCQAQALKLLTPQELEYTMLLWSNESTNGVDHKATYIMLVNKIVTPVKMVVTCARPIRDVIGHIVGSPAQMGGHKMIQNNMAEIDIDSPAWTPKSPLKIEYSYTGAEASMPCSFSER